MKKSRKSVNSKKKVVKVKGIAKTSVDVNEQKVLQSLNTKFDEYLDFPCFFTFKVIGFTRDSLIDDVMMVVQQCAAGDYTYERKASSNGTFESITVKPKVTSKEHIEELYQLLADIEGVKGVL